MDIEQYQPYLSLSLVGTELLLFVEFSTVTEQQTTKIVRRYILKTTYVKLLLL